MASLPRSQTSAPVPSSLRQGSLASSPRRAAAALLLLAGASAHYAPAAEELAL